ncbi:MAG: hypothetical protein K1X87_00655 [Dehalococcoidia bacterium]|nr:hypothetical protein [Dehalococcoidia bacterium]HRC63141.1 hypothetical protein [Dehalococcoidia bacterium]
MGLRSLLLTILSLIWAAILVLVGGRFLALLVDANRDSEIVDRLIRHSDLWVRPFTGLFGLTNEAVNSTGGVFEAASAIAFGFYLVVGLLVFALVNSVSGFGPRYRGPVEG